MTFIQPPPLVLNTWIFDQNLRITPLIVKYSSEWDVNPHQGKIIVARRSLGRLFICCSEDL